MFPIGRKELWHAQIIISLAIVLQLIIAPDLRIGPKYLIVILELLLVLAIGITAPRRHTVAKTIHKAVSFSLIGLISLANAGQLALLANALIGGNTDLPGKTLLSGALAIFLTNIIMFCLWYWELDSPGLSGRYSDARAHHFEFPQKSSAANKWRPTFFDYFYVSLTNSTAFSPTDTMPLTHIAKGLMSIQALIALVTIVLVTARAVNILG